jgi:hypothetical protein
VPDLSGRDLLREWEKLMRSVAGSATSVPRDVWDAQQRIQRDMVTMAVAPFDAVFDMLGQSATTLRSQAEALEAAGKALEDAGRLMRGQAELFERTVHTIRQPTAFIKAAAARDPAAREPQE